MELEIGKSRKMNGVNYTPIDISTLKLSHDEKLDICMLCSFYLDEKSCFESMKVLGNCLGKRDDGKKVIFVENE